MARRPISRELSNPRNAAHSSLSGRATRSLTFLVTVTSLPWSWTGLALPRCRFRTSLRIARCAITLLYFYNFVTAASPGSVIMTVSNHGEPRFGIGPWVRCHVSVRHEFRRIFNHSKGEQTDEDEPQIGAGCSRWHLNRSCWCRGDSCPANEDAAWVRHRGSRRNGPCYYAEIRR